MKNIRDNFESGVESIIDAKGFINSLKQFDFIFFMIIYKEICNIIDILYDILQLKNLDII